MKYVLFTGTNLQYVLVVLGQRTRTHHVSIIAGLSRIDIHNAYYSSRTRLNSNATGLVEFIPGH